MALPALVGAAAALGITKVVDSAKKQGAKQADATGTTMDPASVTVGSEDEKTANRVGRASLIATSPLGVLGTEPVGRRKLLGN